MLPPQRDPPPCGPPKDTLRVLIRVFVQCFHHSRITKEFFTGIGGFRHPVCIDKYAVAGAQDLFLFPIPGAVQDATGGTMFILFEDETGFPVLQDRVFMAAVCRHQLSGGKRKDSKPYGHKQIGLTICTRYTLRHSYQVRMSPASFSGSPFAVSARYIVKITHYVPGTYLQCEFLFVRARLSPISVNSW